MKNVTNIIFDLGGVILNLDNKKTEDAFKAMGTKHFKEYFGPGIADSFFREYEIGKINNRQFLSNLRDLIQVDVADASIIKAWNAMLLDFPAERIALLDELKNKYRLFLLSNTNALHLKAIEEIYRKEYRGRELKDHFEKTYYSHLMGIRKPDKESFQYILDEYHLQAESTLFVDDTLVNVEAATRLGLKGYFLSPGLTIRDIPWDE
jgi:glucose-1-phosphatase